jgi:tRNA1(Val) A37 N6-methylase TrmN6
MNTNKIVETLKQQNMDFEFYPTTDEIINVIKATMPEYGGTILDIGAGNGATLQKLTSGEYSHRWTRYAIEKNQMLKALINTDTLVIGSDFMENKLFDKKFDVIFCNPPYSEYESWVFKIIAEANAKHIYLPIPERWANVQKLQDIIKQRGYVISSLGHFDFLNAERAARCKVEVIHLTAQDYKMKDFFDVELEKFFKFNEPENEHSFTFKERMDEKKQAFTESINNRKLVCGGDYVQAITALYHEEEGRIYDTLRGLSEIDSSLLEALNIELDKIKTFVKDKLRGLSSKYWREVITKLQPIAKRLTERNQKALFNAVTDANMSFNAANIYNVIEWSIKTATKGMEQQILDVYDELISEANCTKYQSNKTIFVGNNFETKTPSKLNLRIVLERHGGINSSSWHSSYYRNNLSERGHTMLADLFVIANNFGFEIDSRESEARHWQSGVGQEFSAVRNGKEVVLMTVRAFYNGNLHIKLNKEFNHKLNVIKGKHEGWIHSVDDVVNEFEVSEKEAKQLFEELPKITVSVAGLLN